MELILDLETEFNPEFWQELAKYRGYSEAKFSTSSSGSSVDVVEHRFPVRAKAAKFLKERGHKVSTELPEKIVISETPRKP